MHAAEMPGPTAAVRSGDRTGGRGLSVARRLWANPWIWSAGTQAVGSGASLVVSVIAARLLGVAGFGGYVLVQACVVLLSGLQYQWVSGPMAVAAGHRTRAPAYFGAVARMALLAAGLIAVAVALASAALAGGADRTLALPLAAAVFAAGAVAHDGAKRLAFAMGRPRTAFAGECARHLLFALALGLAWLARGVDAPALLACGGASALAAAAPVYAGALRSRPRARLRRTVRGHHWRAGRWLVLMALVAAVHEQLATLLAGSWLGADAAAGLRAATILVGPLAVLMASVENIVPRRAAERLRAGGEAAMIRYLLRTLAALELPFVLASAALAVFGADALGALLGRDYTGFSAVAAIIAIGPPLNLAREFGATYLRATRRTRGIFAAFAASAVVTLAASTPLIAAYGVRGAAGTIILGHAVSTAVILALAARAARRALGPA